jgi:hypothetical protein
MIGSHAIEHRRCAAASSATTKATIPAEEIRFNNSDMGIPPILDGYSLVPHKTEAI